MEEIIQEIERGQKTNGLYSPGPGLSANPIRWTSEVIIGTQLSKDKALQDVGYSLCHSLGACWLHGGLYRRRPDDKHGQISQDDYIPLALTSIAVAYAVLNYGEKHSWIFKVPDGTKQPKWKHTFKAWLGRFPGFRAHITFCAKEKPGPFARIGWVFAVWLSTRKVSQDGLFFSWCRVIGYRRQTKRFWFCTKAANHFETYLRKHYPNGGIGEVLQKYFGKNQSVSVKLLWGNFG